MIRIILWVATTLALNACAGQERKYVSQSTEQDAACANCPSRDAAISLQPDLALEARIVDRSFYSAIIANKFPGFEILRRNHFEPYLQHGVRDGRTGSLVVGRFNFDPYPDFVAYLIPIGTTAGSALGRRVDCMGRADADFDCSSSEQWLSARFDTQLELEPAGVHECLGDVEAGEPERISVEAEIDSVGEYSEKGGGFAIKRRDGTEIGCLISD